MTEKDPPQVPARQQREKAIEKLCEHFAADHIQADELERLIDRAHTARSLAELQALVTNLPVLADKAQAGASIPAKHVELHQTIVAIMGGADRKGSWAPAKLTRVFALMGGASLDFRDVRMPPGTTEVQIAAIMGGVEIIVPPGLRVACDGIGIMGGFEQSGAVGADVPDDGPLLRITGLALMGGVEITQRYPGETTRDARKRRKRDRSRGAPDCG
jgi:hypothetical protein